MQVIATSARPTLVTAYAGRAAWSRYDGRRRGYALMAFSHGVVSRVPVRERAVPFDADLGPGLDARPVVVYSRCRVEPQGVLFPQEVPLYFTGRGCRLFEYDFARRRERRINTSARDGLSDYLPSVWRSRVAFARVRDRARGLDRYKPDLYLQRLSSRRAVRLRGGPRGVYRRAFAPADVGGPGPAALDVRGTRLAYAWGFVPGLPESRCPVVAPVDPRDGQTGFEVRVEQPASSPLTVDRRCGYGGYDALLSPDLAADRLVYLLNRVRPGPVFSTTVATFALGTRAPTSGPPTRELLSLSGSFASRLTESHDRATEIVTFDP